MPKDPERAVASVVIPAHNEAAMIGRLLSALEPEHREGLLEVVVVPNGCTDDTAQIARDAGFSVVELSEGGKVLALNAGDDAVEAFPRIYLDADIVIPGSGLVDLVGSMDGPVLAAAPSRRFATEGASWIVRSYLRIWDRLPSVDHSLAGRGCFAITETGRQRWGEFPDLIADDAFVNSQFAPDERFNHPDVVSVVEAPATLGKLLSRKRRGHRGNRQLERSGAEVTSNTAWIGVVRQHPRLLVDVPVYVGVTLAVRVLTRLDERRGSTAWTTDR